MGRSKMFRTVLSLCLLAAVVSSFELTPDNWDSATAGKSVFIKFLAPWWGHCKSMKPSWDQLMDEFKDSKTALIADVDCTVHEDLQTFAKENLGPSCGPNNLDLCDEEAKKSISDAQALSDADLDAKIKEKEGELEKAEETFKNEVEKL